MKNEEVQVRLCIFLYIMCKKNVLIHYLFIHSFSSLFYDLSIASSEESSPSIAF